MAYSQASTASTNKGADDFSFMVNGELHKVCPYDKYHSVIHTKFLTHLMKCRQNYALFKTKNGETAKELTCKYNPLHQVPEMELLYHEATCPDKAKEVVKNFFSQEFEMLENMFNELGGQPALDALKKVKAADIAAVSKKDNESEVSKAATAMLNMYIEFRPPSTNEAIPSSSSSGRPDAAKVEEETSYGMRTRRRRQKTVRQALAERYPYKPKPGVDELDDEDYWNQNTAGSFDWMKNWQNLPAPTLSFPPGLTTAQRKEFVIHNTIRMATERGHGTLPTELLEATKDDTDLMIKK